MNDNEYLKNVIETLLKLLIRTSDLFENCRCSDDQVYAGLPELHDDINGAIDKYGEIK